MKLTLLVVALGAVSALEWVDFMATDQATGLEMPFTYGAKAGGNGGGEKIVDCDMKNGIKKLCFQVGSTYLGKTSVTCGDGTTSTCGAARGSGHKSGATLDCWTRSGNQRIRGLVCNVKNNYVNACKALGTNGQVLKTWTASGGGTEVSALPKGFSAKLIGTGVCGNYDHTRIRRTKNADECAAKCKARFSTCMNVEFGPNGDCDCDKSTKVCSKTSRYWRYKLYSSGWRASWKTYEIVSKPGVNNGKELRALKLRCGWWMDAVQAGFGNPPPAPKNAAFSSTGIKVDNCSVNDKKTWLRGPILAEKGKRLTGSLKYRDQGVGIKETSVFVKCGTTSKKICGPFQDRSAPINYATCTVNLDLGFCNKGQRLYVQYQAGNRFYGRDAQLTISYKAPLADAAFGLEDEFVSPMSEDEIDAPAAFASTEFMQAQEAEIPATYTIGGAAIVSFVAVGSYMLGRRNRAEYATLLDA